MTRALTARLSLQRCLIRSLELLYGPDFTPHVRTIVADSACSADPSDRNARSESGMPLTQDELELQERALDRIRNRRLPADVPQCIWAGQGSGKICCLCVLWELEAVRLSESRMVRTSSPGDPGTLRGSE